MVRTFDFVFLLKRSEEERDKIYSMMEETEKSYDSLKELIDSDDKQDTEFYIKYL